jgi:hypothetical protein
LLDIPLWGKHFSALAVDESLLTGVIKQVNGIFVEHK